MPKITISGKGYLRESNNRKRDSNIHVQVAEQKIGRKLGKKEIPHHIDENKLNNNEENLMVLRNETSHRLVHSNIPHELFKTKDGSYVAIKEQRECPYCHGMFEPSRNDDVYCDIKCFLADKAKNIPTAEELKQLVWSVPCSTLAKTFNVSDNAITNWCEKHGIDKPPRGYWQKKAFGKI